MAIPLLFQPLLPAAATPQLTGFKGYELDTSSNPVPSYSRLDFYKASLVTGHVVLQYAGRALELNGTHLVFANPHTAYSTLLLSAEVAGYTCLFTEQFVQANGWFERLPHCLLFQREGLLACQLTGGQALHSTSVFEKMLAAQGTDYPFKGELVCACLQVLLHEGLRMQRPASLGRPQPTAYR